MYKYNTLTIKGGNKVILKNGTKILPGNHVHITSIENVCDGKPIKSLAGNCYSTNSNNKHLVSFPSSKEEDEISLYPNPNKAYFHINYKTILKKENISLFGMLGNVIPFKLSNNTIKISSNYMGLVILNSKVETLKFIKEE
jgi:hypothetical protein